MNKYCLLMILVSQHCLSAESDWCTQEGVDQYAVLLRNEVSRNIKYPKVAEIRGWQGTGIINFLIIDRVAFVKERTQSTGYTILDSAMEDAINKSTFPQLPCKTMNTHITVAVPITFALDFKSRTQHLHEILHE